MVGKVGPEVLALHTVARFANDPVRLGSNLHWNVTQLLSQVRDGLHAATAASQDAPLVSAGVDSWAVDYGLLRAGSLLGIPHHYRDEGRGTTGPPRVHRLIGREELFRRTGLQFLPFTTLYQLASDPLLALSDRLLMIPDLIGYWLTGNAVSERTNASTTGLLSAATRDWDHEIICRLGLRSEIFGKVTDPGARIGDISMRRGARLPLVAVGSHDTASAVVGTPMETAGSAFISCGTWGLVGLELDAPVLTDDARNANFTNEGGVDAKVRFLTNITGTWLLSESLRAWQEQGTPEDLEQLLQAAGAVDHFVTFDVQDSRFVPPGDMPTRIGEWCEERGLRAPQSRPAVVRSVVESLAEAFARAVETAVRLTGRRVDTIHVVGGGARNTPLCQSIADRSGRRVVAGPVEATAIGNLLVQARAAGVVGPDLEAMRAVIRATQRLRTFNPREPGERWSLRRRP